MAKWVSHHVEMTKPLDIQDSASLRWKIQCVILQQHTVVTENDSAIFLRCEGTGVMQDHPERFCILIQIHLP